MEREYEVFSLGGASIKFSRWSYYRNWGGVSVYEGSVWRQSNSSTHEECYSVYCRGVIELRG